MPSKSILESLREFETTLLANAIGYIDPTPVHEWYMGGSIRSMTPGAGPVAGVAVTCKLDTSTPGGTADQDPYWRQLERMQMIGLPVVWIVECVGQRPDHECAVGDGMAKILHSCGCVGAVTNGGVRDIRGMLTVPFSAHARGLVVHHGAMRFSAPDEPVDVGGIVVRSGEVIHADVEGVIRIPSGCLEALPEAATKLRLAETQVHEIWRRTDVSLEQKRRHAGEVYARNGFQPRTTRHGPPGEGGR
jgi:regulator of RNase E activity RraA